MRTDWAKIDLTYKQYIEFLDKEINKVVDASFTGAKVDKTLGLWNMFFLLVQLRNEDYASARPSRDEINCMSDKVMCQDVYTRIMKGLWPPSYNPDDPYGPDDGNGGGGPGDPGVPGTVDGVGSMIIRQDGVLLADLKKPVNRININL